MVLYGCELWNISSKYTNHLICNIRSNCTQSFIYNALHHPNEFVSLLLHVKLASSNPVFAENVRDYNSIEWQISQVKKQFSH